MKREDEIICKSKIANEVKENLVDDILEFNRSFVDNFGMTLDQFEKLDFSNQEKLTERVSILNKKNKNLLKHYQKIQKVKNKSLFKKK